MGTGLACNENSRAGGEMSADPVKLPEEVERDFEHVRIGTIQWKSGLEALSRIRKALEEALVKARKFDIEEAAARQVKLRSRYDGDPDECD